ncbi:MAG: gliding motility-associated C-terminal domain-containing protein [Salibacteraceae bacterium]|nr:gliding motility-associated C-terminal domain-containing protein [Salibacteraceae bacterium]
MLNCTHSGANVPIKLYVRNSVDKVDSVIAHILIADTIAPKIRTQNYTAYLDINGTATVANAAIINGITDNCAVANYNITPNSFTCADVGVNNAIISATDQNGNTATTSATISILDTIAPLVGTQNITVYLDENGTASISPSDVDNFSTDNCSISSMAVMPNAFTCANIGINTVMLKVTDASGNENSAIAMVTVFDTISPIAISHDISIYLGLNGTASLAPVEVNNGSSDNCSVTSMNVYPSHFDQSKIGENLVTLEIIDQCGNRDTTYSIVTVVDTIPPTPLVQNITVYLDANGNSVITPNQVDYGSFDNCGVDSIFLSQFEFSCDDIGQNMIYFTAKDINENSAKAYIIATVIDTVAPTVSTKSITLYLDENGKATTSASKVNYGSFDNCGIDSIYLSDSIFVFTDGDRIVVDLFVLDASGNMNSAPAVVYLTDTIVPEITCPDNFGTCDINISYKLPEVLENTEIRSLTLTEGLPSGNEFEVGLTSNTYVVTDLSGNQNSCSFYIERYALPTVSLVPDTTVYYAENLSLAYTDSLAVSYQWTPSVCLSDANEKYPVCAPTENTKYTLEVTSENGCKAMDDVYVTVINEIKFAKAFSPNGDGQNDFFEIYGIELYPDCQVTILNRFGTIVFTSIGYANPWDGKFENEVLPVASYFYIIALDDHQKPLTGSISIIR